MTNERPPQLKIRASDLEHWLPSLTDSRFGVVKLGRPLSMEFYDQWLSEGHHGEMKYLARHRDLKADPKKWAPFAHSAIVFAINYYRRENSYVTTDLNWPRVAKYVSYAAQNADYHTVIRTHLQPVLTALQLRYPGAEFRLSVDAEPILERDLATRAGLGWVGKNTCVLDRAGGSFFFIAEILTSLETDDLDRIATDHCGTCTRCLDACPTSALIRPKVLDATKCISYWTIEAKTAPPRELSQHFGDWYFGCDICQSVCPWNQKVFGRETLRRESVPSLAEAEGATTRQALTDELRAILSASNRELARRFKGTPLERARAFGLKRNALIVAGNLKITELQPEVQALASGAVASGPLASEAPASAKLRSLAREILAELES